MPRLKYKKKGKRVNVWIPERQLKVAAQIDNLSAFLQMCLDQAPDIMAYAILHSTDPQKYYIRNKIENVVDEFNAKYPQDDLTKRRENKKAWRASSPKLPKTLS